MEWKEEKRNKEKSVRPMDWMEETGLKNRELRRKDKSKYDRSAKRSS